MYDYLEISFGSFTWKYCGDQVPQPLISSGPSMKIKFHSDNIGSKTGFLFKWEELEGNNYSVLIICLSHLISATTLLNTSSNYISSPNYPNNYFDDASKVRVTLAEALNVIV